MTTPSTDEKKSTEVGSDVFAKIQQSVEKERGDYAKLKSQMDALVIQHADDVDQELSEIIEKFGRVGPEMTKQHTYEKKPPDAGARLKAQASKAALCDDVATGLDVQIAQLVFGVDSSATQMWPWGVPPFSTDRNWCAAVLWRMLVHQAASEFDAALERRAILWGWKNDGKNKNIPALILVLTPDEICKAALDAIQQFNCEE